MDEHHMLSARAMMGMVLMGVALLGGVLATYYNVHNAVGPKEKAFTTRVCTISWIVAVSMLLTVYFLPSPIRFVAAALYLIICPPLVYKWTNTHQLIRIIELRELDELEEQALKAEQHGDKTEP